MLRRFLTVPLPLLARADEVTVSDGPTTGKASREY